MSDEVSDRESGVAAAAVNENQKLAAQEEQITKPAPKVKPQREKDPKKVAAGKKLAEKNRQAKAALEREIKREIAEKEKDNENSAGWLPEMSFQTVLSIVGVAFSAFEMYKRFHPKSSSGSVQNTISPQAEPKHSVAPTRVAPTSGAEQRSELGESQAPTRVEPAGETPRSALSSKIGMA